MKIAFETFDRLGVEGLKSHRLGSIALRDAHAELSGAISPSDMLELSRHRNEKMRMALKQAAELVRLVRIFKSHGIEAVSLKGPLLSLQLYGDVALRESKDLDLLVNPDDVAVATEILRRESYDRIPDQAGWSAAQMAFHRRVSKDYVFVSQRLGICVELHWRFLENPHVFTPNTKQLRESTVTTSFAGEPIRHLDEMTTLIYLCCHGATHAWMRLLWLADVAVLMNSHAQNWHWPDVIERADSLNAKRPLLEGALFAHRLLGSFLPDEMARYEREDRALAWRVRMLMRKAYDLPRFGLMQSVRLLWRTLPMHSSLAHKRFVLTRSFWPSSNDWETLRLPDSLFGLYYALRPFLTLYRRLRRNTEVIAALRGRAASH